LFIFSFFFSALALVLHYIISFFMILVIARAVLSWVSPDPYNPIVRFINNSTEPVLQPVRRRLPLVYSGMDFSPLVVILALIFLDSFLVPTLTELAVRIR